MKANAVNGCGGKWLVLRRAARTAALAVFLLGWCDIPKAVDFTFVVASDLHYTLHDSLNQNSKSVADSINAYAAGVATFPESVGGKVVEEPKFIALDGDMVDGYDSTAVMKRQFALFRADWGLQGEKRVHYPVYPGLGNHDQLGLKSVDERSVIDSMKRQNASRSGLLSVSGDSLSYSWNRHGVHFAQVNLFGGYDKDRVPVNQVLPPRNSLEFLVQDLETNVAGSKMPVVIFQHYGIDSTDFYYTNASGVYKPAHWWTIEQSDTLYNAIKQYNVVGIFTGHTHVANFSKWKEFDVYNDGATKYSDHLMVNITDSTMIVAHRKNGAWTKNLQKKAISFPSIGVGRISGARHAEPSLKWSLSPSRKMTIAMAGISEGGGAVVLRFINLAGQVVWTERVKLDGSGEARLLVDAADWWNGVYAIQIAGGSIRAGWTGIVVR